MRYFQGGAHRSVAVAAARLLLAVLDLGLLVQNSRLKREMSVGELMPPIGRKVPPLQGISVSGEPLTVRYNDGQKRTFLFVFARGCEICTRAWPESRSLVAAANPQISKVAFVATPGGISPGYAKSVGIAAYPIFAELDPKVMVALNLRLAPEIVQIDSSGVVHRSMAGSA